MTDDFLPSFKDFLVRHGWSAKTSPWEIIERWESFVDECVDCYQWGFYEFDNEVKVRESLEFAIADQGLAGHEQMAEIRERVWAADEKFDRLLGPEKIRGEKFPWWRRGVLAHAGDEYQDDIKRLYKIDVQPCQRAAELVEVRYRLPPGRLIGSVMGCQLPGYSQLDERGGAGRR
jgi:hypothetical protein